MLLRAPNHPELSDASYPIYTIRPEAVYDQPQRVWLPLPDDADPFAIDIYYYHPNGEHRGWYPAEHVLGWLVADSYEILEESGTTYLGFLIRHAAIVQLGFPEE